MEETKLTGAQKAELIHLYEAHTMGTENFYQEHYWSTRYTDGIKYLAETCEAFWLIDNVAIYQSHIRMRNRLEDTSFQVWQISKDSNGEGVLEAWTDTPNAEGSVRLFHHLIGWTDFPEELMPYQFYVEDNVMMMKRER